MKKQILKLALAASLVGAFAVLCVPAEAADISAKIPFSFTVNGKTLPPGTYEVSPRDAFLLVRGSRGAAVVLAGTTESAPDSAPKLVFHKYGDQYILRQAWLGGGTGRLLPASRLERELAGNGRSSKLASTLEHVVIAAY